MAGYRIAERLPRDGISGLKRIAMAFSLPRCLRPSMYLSIAAHSSDAPFDNGWDCDLGFRRNQGRCLRAIVRAHGHWVDATDHREAIAAC